MAQSSQKFIARNRAPRVQIEYDVELYGAEKKIELPFVMGVVADLTGKPQEGQEVVPMAQRKFLEIDAENLDKRLKAMKPSVAFRVPNMLTGRGRTECGYHVREHGRFLARRSRPQGEWIEGNAGGAHPTRKPVDIHGREDGSRKAHCTVDFRPAMLRR